MPLNFGKVCLFAFGIAFALAIVFSCTEYEFNSRFIDNISGFSQKGPFAKGSAITIWEFNANTAKTERSFATSVTDDDGSFGIKNLDLTTPYVLIKAEGFYRSEESGNLSASPITLYSLADVKSKGKVNVNVLTHLEK